MRPFHWPMLPPFALAQALANVNSFDATSEVF